MELVSPELILVAPPELARLAREQLPDPRETAPVAKAPAQVVRRRWPAAVFGVCCALNSSAPIALAIAFH